MTSSLSQPHGWRLWIQRLIARPRFTAFLAPFVHRLDIPLMRLSGGRFSFSGFLAGWETVAVTTRGAKSGLLRTLPLIGIPDGEKIVLIASNFGRPHHPAWYHNLKAYPQVQVKRGGRTAAYSAYEAEGEERQRYWDLAQRVYIGFPLYAQRAAPRRIPVMVLIPAA